MARHKDHDWDLPTGTRNQNGGFTVPWDYVHAAILMDIRDELKRLNSLLYCSNFTGIQRTLRAIRAAVEKPKKRLKRSAKRK